MDTSKPKPTAWWTAQMTRIGRRASRGQSVELVNAVPPTAVTEEACEVFLNGVDAVLASAMNGPREGKHSVLPLRESIDLYLRGAACILGLSLHAADGDEILDEVFSEMRAARDALNTLDPRHWDREAFVREVKLAETAFAPQGWRPKLEVLSFLHDDSAQSIAA